MVTLTATLRGNLSTKGDEKANHESIILVAHALSRMCISLEEKNKGCVGHLYNETFSGSWLWGALEGILCPKLGPIVQQGNIHMRLLS